jgi:hypothetical protein
VRVPDTSKITPTLKAGGVVTEEVAVVVTTEESDVVRVVVAVVTLVNVVIDVLVTVVVGIVDVEVVGIGVEIISVISGTASRCVSYSGGLMKRCFL